MRITARGRCQDGKKEVSDTVLMGISITDICWELKELKVKRILSSKTKTYSKPCLLGNVLLTLLNCFFRRFLRFFMASLGYLNLRDPVKYVLQDR